MHKVCLSHTVSVNIPSDASGVLHVDALVFTLSQQGNVRHKNTEMNFNNSAPGPLLKYHPGAFLFSVTASQYALHALCISASTSAKTTTPL